MWKGKVRFVGLGDNSGENVVVVLRCGDGLGRSWLSEMEVVCFRK